MRRQDRLALGMVAHLRAELDRHKLKAARWDRVRAAWDAGRTPDEIDDLIAEIVGEDAGGEVRRAG